MAATQTQVPTNNATGVTTLAQLDQKLEVIVIPVTDVDRARTFYAKLGWRLDADISAGAAFRVVQFTPHGSACSVQFGVNLTSAAPGSARAYLVVSDIETARTTLLSSGAGVSEIFHIGPSGRVPGPDPDHRTYASRATFTDPDSNTWILQEITNRLPGRIDPDTTSFSSASDLASALRRAAAAHGQHEARIGHADPNWPDWYAEYMVREQSGAELPQ